MSAGDTAYRVEALGPATWDAYAALLERHNGVFGGCWCTWFHTMVADKPREAGKNRELKEERVHRGTSHAAVVLKGDEAVAWAQYGPPVELPNVYHRKELEESGDPAPDWRIVAYEDGWLDAPRRHVQRVAALRNAGAAHTPAPLLADACTAPGAQHPGRVGPAEGARSHS